MANGTDLVLLTVPLSAYCLNKFKPTIEYFDHTMQDLKTILWLVVHLVVHLWYNLHCHYWAVTYDLYSVLSFHVVVTSLSAWFDQLSWLNWISDEIQLDRMSGDDDANDEYIHWVYNYITFNVKMAISCILEFLSLEMVTLFSSPAFSNASGVRFATSWTTLFCLFWSSDLYIRCNFLLCERPYMSNRCNILQPLLEHQSNADIKGSTHAVHLKHTL